MTIPRVTDIHNYHNKKCNEKTCIGYRLEPNLHKKKGKGIDYDFKTGTDTKFEYVKDSYYMTNYQYRKAKKEIIKFAKSLSPNLKVIKDGKGTFYLSFFGKKGFYWKNSIRVYTYGSGNNVSDIALEFTDKKDKRHSKRILVNGLHRFEYAIRIVVRHYEKIYKN